MCRSMIDSATIYECCMYGQLCGSVVISGGKLTGQACLRNKLTGQACLREIF